MSGAAALLSECVVRGRPSLWSFQLAHRTKGDGYGFIDRLRAHKAELIELLKGSVSQYALTTRPDTGRLYCRSVGARSHKALHGVRIATPCDAGRHLSRRDRWRLVRGDGCDRGGWIFSCRLICKQLLLPM